MSLTHDAIENIDIGGVTLIRAAAKNHERVTLVCDPADYNIILGDLHTGEISPAKTCETCSKRLCHHCSL